MIKACSILIITILILSSCVTVQPGKEHAVVAETEQGDDAGADTKADTAVGSEPESATAKEADDVAAEDATTTNTEVATIATAKTSSEVTVSGDVSHEGTDVASFETSGEAPSEASDEVMNETSDAADMRESTDVLPSQPSESLDDAPRISSLPETVDQEPAAAPADHSVEADTASKPLPEPDVQNASNVASTDATEIGESDLAIEITVPAEPIVMEADDRSDSLGAESPGSAQSGASTAPLPDEATTVSAVASLKELTDTHPEVSTDNASGQTAETDALEMDSDVTVSDLADESPNNTRVATAADIDVDMEVDVRSDVRSDADTDASSEAHSKTGTDVAADTGIGTNTDENIDTEDAELDTLPASDNGFATSIAADATAGIDTAISIKTTDEGDAAPSGGMLSSTDSTGENLSDADSSVAMSVTREDAQPAVAEVGSIARENAADEEAAGDSETIRVASVVAVEPAHEPLTRSELSAIATSQLPVESLPISTNEGFLSIYHDFDDDGFTDVFLLSAKPVVQSFGTANNENIESVEPETLDLSTLTDPAVLFDRKANVYEWFVSGFLQRDGQVEPIGSAEVGLFKMFETAELVEVNANEKRPVAISCSFGSQQGSVVEWVIFTDSGVSRLTLRERMGSAATVDDIDNDGIIDVVLSNEVFEVGIGYETYLSWLKWTGNTYELYRTENVVRSLRNFLAEACTELSEGRIEDFHKRIGPAGDEEQTIWEEIFGEVFTLVPTTANFVNEPIPSESQITRIVHAEILENPFTQYDELGTAFPLSVRIETANRTVHLYSVKVYMSTNPFQDRRFFFARDDRS